MTLTTTEARRQLTVKGRPEPSSWRVGGDLSKLRETLSSCPRNFVFLPVHTDLPWDIEAHRGGGGITYCTQWFFTHEFQLFVDRLNAFCIWRSLSRYSHRHQQRRFSKVHLSLGSFMSPREMNHFLFTHLK